MRLLTVLLLTALSCLGQIGTPTGSQFSENGGGSGAVSAAATTTAGRALFTYYGQQTACGSTSLNTVFDTGGDAFIPVIPSNGASINGYKILAGGSSCTSDPNCTVVGGGGSGATCLATRNPGTGAVNAVTVSVPGTGYTSQPTVVLDSSCSGYSIVPIAYGVGNASACTFAWYSPNIAGTVNNQVTVTAYTSSSFRGISVAEISGLDTTAPLVATAGAGSTAATSITSNAFNTTDANTIALCGSRVEALTQTWTPGSGFALVSGGTVTGTFLTMEYDIFDAPQTSKTASISSGANAVRAMICGVFKQAAAPGGSVVRRRMIN